MTTYNTGAPVPSVDVRDLYDNAENLDNFSNGAALAYTDRKGVSRQSLAGIRAASSYQHLGAYGAGLVFTSYNQTFSYLGEFYAPSAGVALPYTTTGVGAAEVATFRNVGDALLRGDLSASTGASLVKFGSVTVADELTRGAAQSTSPEQHGYLAGGTLAQRTAAVQAAFNFANTNKVDIRLNKTYRVDTIQLFDHVEYGITGTGNLIGEAAVARAAVLEMKNCRGIKSSSTITISGNDNLNYGCAIKVWSDVVGGSSLLFLDFNAIQSYIGWLFGDAAQPDRLLSEIVISKGFTFSTPQPAAVIGTQAVIEFNGYQLIAEANAPFAAITPVVATAIGSAIHINGGETILASSATGRAFIIQPIDSPIYDNAYGNITVNGSQIESASLMLLAYNPSSVPSVAPNTGGLRLSACSGYHNFSGVTFQGGADFSGSLVVDAACNFYAPALRTADTASMYGPAQVSLSAEAFYNFKPLLSSISGGIARFPKQVIFQANNLNGVVSTASTTQTLKFTVVPAAGNNLRFSSAYNPATGIFTVPDGGLKSVEVFTQFSTIAARPSSEVTVQADGFPWGASGAPSKYVMQSVPLGDLAAGAQIKVAFQNLDATFNFGSTSVDRIMISASC